MFVVVEPIFMEFWRSFGCCFVSGLSCWLQQCCIVMILAEDGGSDGFGVGRLTGGGVSKGKKKKMNGGFGWFEVVFAGQKKEE
ncbi:hypothetical protein H5410_062464 [Solanum commersonii]|uniref:Uncharacterized protein n=1 Tax=Solanum commersonii TaxID=4109 RepID=A0A9J5WAX2_SOLCO|nr:hypothetical protein H5410_062464 [Solanum commersonii]